RAARSRRIAGARRTLGGFPPDGRPAPRPRSDRFPARASRIACAARHRRVLRPGARRGASTTGPTAPPPQEPSAMTDASAPPRHLLGNGRLTTMLGANGAGFLRWRELAVTRWREDPVTDPWGHFLLLRDEDDGAV